METIAGHSKEEYRDFSKEYMDNLSVEEQEVVDDSWLDEVIKDLKKYAEKNNTTIDALFPKVYGGFLDFDGHMKFYSEEEFKDKNVENVDHSIDEKVENLRNYTAETGLSIELHYLGGSKQKQYTKNNK